jgi:hypothetical protein
MPLIKTESGCKVGWHFYDNEEEAVEAGKEARKRAIDMAFRGYDFGYMWPGEVKKETDKDGNDVWVVIVP